MLSPGEEWRFGFLLPEPPNELLCRFGCLWGQCACSRHFELLLHGPPRRRGPIQEKEEIRSRTGIWQQIRDVAPLRQRPGHPLRRARDFTQNGVIVTLLRMWSQNCECMPAFEFHIRANNDL